MRTTKIFTFRILTIIISVGIVRCTTYNNKETKRVRFERIVEGHFVVNKASTGGVSWVDYNDDGIIDLFVANGYNTSKPNSPAQPNYLYKNDSGRFKRTASAMTQGFNGYSSSSSWADYDNDGDVDVFISNQKNSNNWLFNRTTNQKYVLDSLSIVSSDGGASFSADWVDVDNDGLLDLYVSNGGFTRKQPDFLYKNEGEGKFKKIIDNLIVLDSTASVGGVWGDYDNDGDRDLFVPNTMGPGVLYINKGNWEFERDKGTVIDLAPKHGFASSSSAQWVDYDNDLDLDLYVFNQYGLASQLYENDGNGHFREVENILPTTMPSNAGGALWADYDNDGDQDLICSNWGAGFIYYENDSGQFSAVLDVQMSKIISYTSSIACADYDNDGDLDVYVGNWPNRQGEHERNMFFRNETENANNWLKIKLQGSKSNRDGIGSKIYITYKKDDETFKQFKEVSLTANFRSQSDIVQHFGLGQQKNIEMIEVRWPSGLSSKLYNVKTNQLIKILEHSE